MTRRALLGAALAAPAVRAAHAEVSEVIVSKQFGTLYLQQDVMESQRLIEKHGGLLGLPNLRASYIRWLMSGSGVLALIIGRVRR